MTGLAFVFAALLIFAAGVVVGSAGVVTPFWTAMVAVVDSFENGLRALVGLLGWACYGLVRILAYVANVAASWGRRHANRKRARHLSAVARVGLAGSLH